MKENTPPLTLQNHYSKQTNHPTLIGVFLMEMPTKRERELGASLCETKILNFTILLNIASTKKLSFLAPLLISDHILWKKVSLIAFRQILLNVFMHFHACIFSYTIMAYLKKLDGTKSLKTKYYPVRLSSRIIPRYLPSYQNFSSFDVALLHPPGMDCPPFT